MKKLLVLILFTLSSTTWADVLGFRASGGIFDYEVTGTLRDSGSAVDEMDLKNELGIKDDSDTTTYVYLEHPVPLIPNIRVGHTALQLSGTGNVTATFNGVAFNEAVRSDIDLSHTEIALYYELIDIGFDFDLGINVKLFDNYATLTAIDGNPAPESAKLDAVVPMIYGAINIPIFNTGFHIAGDMSVISYDGNELSDVLLRVKYETDYHFGVEAGIRNITIKYEDTTDQTYADIKVKGPYIAAYLYF